MFNGIKLILSGVFNPYGSGAVPAAARNNMPKTKTYRRWLVGVVLAGVLLMLQTPVTARAQDQDDDQDPPSRVARLNYAQGSVTFQPGGEGDWVTAVPNRPLTSGDNLWTDQDARAELHVGSAAIRLAPETSMTVLDLDDRTIATPLVGRHADAASAPSR
jgi:hypothetical protein